MTEVTPEIIDKVVPTLQSAGTGRIESTGGVSCLDREQSESNLCPGAELVTLCPELCQSSRSAPAPGVMTGAVREIQ